MVGYLHPFTRVYLRLLMFLFWAVVMVSVVDAQREVLLKPIGTNVWSGQVPQSLNSAAVTWSLAKQLYGIDGPYVAIPMSLLFGMVPTFIQWLISKVCYYFLSPHAHLLNVNHLALANDWARES
jgi:hypothetical protein